MYISSNKHIIHTNTTNIHTPTPTCTHIRVRTNINTSHTHVHTLPRARTHSKHEEHAKGKDSDLEPQNLRLGRPQLGPQANDQNSAKQQMTKLCDIIIIIRGVVGHGRKWTVSTHFFLRNDPLCTFYVRL